MRQNDTQNELELSLSTGFPLQDDTLNERQIINFLRKIKLPEDLNDSSTNDCWEWKASTRNEYGAFRLNGKTIKAHRLSYQLFVGEIPEMIKCSISGKMEKCCVLHNCHDRKCCNPKHLRLGSNAENMRDKFRADPNKHHSCCKLSWANIYRVRYLYGSGEYTLQDLAEMFEVSRRTIYNWTTGNYSNLSRENC